ncbi:MAG: hypothetical protein MJ172_06295 [Clostridia bacterium]|nr:hypothetical protein [Clostridia bacterium]
MRFHILRNRNNIVTIIMLSLMLIMATSGFSAKEVMDYSVTVPDESLYLFSGTMCKDEFPNQD